ncbi:MAG: SCP2 sterol-binding domain-containing protein [Acidobacteriota bacterium]
MTTSSEPLIAFSPPWAAALADALRANEDYRRHAQTWEGTLAFVLAADAEATGRGVVLDLWHGDCRDARSVEAPDGGAALDVDYVIRGNAAAWERVLTGSLEPIFGLMSGKLKLVRGKLTGLTPYIKASKAIVQSAVDIGSQLPDDA